jgi:hypothetical protein
MEPIAKPEKMESKVSVLIVSKNDYLFNLARILSAFLISFCAVFLSTQASALVIVLINLACCFVGFISQCEE